MLMLNVTDVAMSDKIVYSTGSGDLRKKPGGARPAHSGIKHDGIVRVQKESKGRGGKTVSVIYGLRMPASGLSDLASALKQKCGAGGSVKDGSVIIQGDKVDVIISYLTNLGFSVKRSGGA